MGRPLIAVTSDSRTGYLKQLAFLFDQFLFVSPSLFSRRAETESEWRLAQRFGVSVSVGPDDDITRSQDKAELDWLVERGVVRYLAEAVPIRKAVTGIGSLSGTEKDVVSRGGEQGLDLFLSLLARGGAAVLKQKDVDAVALTRSATAFCPTLESRPPYAAER